MWISVSLPADARTAEALSDALLDAGALSVDIVDADAGTEAETPQFAEPGETPATLWAHSIVNALFDADHDVDASVAEAARALGIEPPPTTCTPVAEQNWVQLTQSQFEPIQVSKRLWIVPSWHEAPAAGAINIALDPGMAFGTGSHPTTHLCLAWLDATDLDGRRVLDYGCGSGILAIAAKRLGAGRVVAVDIDDKAVMAARDNAQNNAVDLVVASSRDPIDGQFDIVIANILTNPLCVLAPALAARVVPGGVLVLSGVLEHQAAQVMAAYAPHLPLVVSDTRDGWARLEGQRPR